MFYIAIKSFQALLKLSRQALSCEPALNCEAALGSSLQPLLVAVVTFVSAYTICSLLKAIEELVFILPT